MLDKIYLLLYVFNCLLSLVLGGMAIRSPRYFKIFVLYLVFFPANYMIVNSYVRFNMIAFDFFLFPFWARFFAQLVLGQVRSNRFLVVEISMLAFLGFYILLMASGVLPFSKITYLIKDLKPFFYFSSAIILFNFFTAPRHHLPTITEQQLQKYLVVKSLFCFLAFLAVSFTPLPNLLSADLVFTLEKEKMRYADFSMVLSVVVLLNQLRNPFGKPNLTTVLCLFIILLTGSRTILVFFIIAILFASMRKFSFRQMLVMTGTVMVITILFLFIMNGNGEGGMQRFAELFDKQQLLGSFAIRFSPFIDTVSNFSLLQFITGGGLGMPFFIPWFEFRENLDPYNIALDNAYLTLYGKYGIFSIAYWAIFLYIVRRLTFSRNVFNVYSLYFLFSAVTTSIFFQDVFSIFIFFLIFFPLTDSYIKKAYI